MIVKCTYPSGAKNANLRCFNHVCDVCGGEVSLTGNLGSGELWKDSKGELFLSIRRSNASTSLVAVSEDGYLIESSEITWPLLRFRNYMASIAMPSRYYITVDTKKR
jgi:hypothetical protein